MPRAGPLLKPKAEMGPEGMHLRSLQAQAPTELVPGPRKRPRMLPKTREKRMQCPEAQLYRLLRRLRPERRRHLAERFSQAQRLALERWILDGGLACQSGGGARSPTPLGRATEGSKALRRGRRGPGRGVHCRVHGGRQLYRAAATVGPFHVASRYDADLTTAERFRDVLHGVARRVAEATSDSEVERSFRAALADEPRKWGLNGCEDMCLCFTVSVSAKHWVGRPLVTPRFALTKLEEGLRAWRKLRQARALVGNGPMNRYSQKRLPNLDAAWQPLSQAFLDAWALAGRSAVSKAARKLEALRERHKQRAVTRPSVPEDPGVSLEALEKRINQLLAAWAPRD